MSKIADLRGDEDEERAEICQFLGKFDRNGMSFEKTSNQWKCIGLVANACDSLASTRVRLRGITIDASIRTTESAVSCRVGLYELCRPGKELKKYFHQENHMTKGNVFVRAGDWREFMQNFSQDTEMAVMDYKEIQIVKEEILDLQCGGATADNRRIKWDILIDGGDGVTVNHDKQGFPSDALHMFSYHLNRNANSWIFYGSMMYFTK